MTATRRKRPWRLLMALAEAQEAVGEALATSPSRNDPGWHYAGSDDVQRAARKVLSDHGLMVLPESTEVRQEGERQVVRIVVSVWHLPSRQCQERVFETQIDDRWGSTSSIRNLFALALQMLLNIARRPDELMPVMEPDGVPAHLNAVDRVYQGTVRVPAPLRPKLGGGDRELLKARVHERGLQLARLVSTSPREWRAEAGVPLDGELSMRELRSYETTLDRLIWENAPPADESGGHLRVPEPDDEREDTSTD